MYKYKFTNDEGFKVNYKKELSKILFIRSLIFSAVAYVTIFLLISVALKINERFNLRSFLAVGALTIIVELIVVPIYYKKEVKNLIDNISDTELDISFNEEGISINSDNATRHVNWKGVRSIKVSKENLIFNYKVDGITSNIFFLDKFDTEKEVIIKDIEKYTKVRR